jgi:carboxynorspermidine decarboxylase
MYIYKYKMKDSKPKVKSIKRLCSSKSIATPFFLVDADAIEKNLLILKKIKQKTECKILLAQKAFSMYSLYPLISRYLDGVCASGLYEAKLGHEEFRKEVHTYQPAYRDSEFKEILKLSSHIVFNTIGQYRAFASACMMHEKQSINASGKKESNNDQDERTNLKIGLRVNPEKSPPNVKYTCYDPCTQNSRLGEKQHNMIDSCFRGKGRITGLHFHALCENNSEDFHHVLAEFEKKFDHYIDIVEWVNFGGGQLITSKEYDINHLIRLINSFKKRHPNIKQIYLEPGEAVVLNSGFLCATVLDVIKNKKDADKDCKIKHSSKDEMIAILDISAETHIPDALITRNDNCPYTPPVLGECKDGKYTYLFSGISCAAGDYIRNYSFNNQLKRTNRIIFLDMAHYSMVKTSTFNGVKLPDIYVHKKGTIKKIRSFGYSDFKDRLS